MTILKKKSLLVAAVSSAVIAIVLVVNIAAYMLYLEMKDRELEKAYVSMMEKANALWYSRHIEIVKLGARFEVSGALKGKPIIEGIVRNDGHKEISDLVVNVKFLDNDGAVIYQIAIDPLEPSLPHAGIDVYPRLRIKPENSLPFKRIISDCPREVLSELKDGPSPGKPSGRWSGRMNYEIASVKF